MAVTTDEYRRARHLVSEASEILYNHLREGARGPVGVHPRILLTGLALSLDMFGDAHFRKVHKVLTHYLPRELQWDLGVRVQSGDGTFEVLSETAFYSLTKSIRQKLDYTRIRAIGLGQEERHKRRDVVDAISAALIAASSCPRPEGAEDYALDATALWAHERYVKELPLGPITKTGDADQEASEIDLLNNALTTQDSKEPISRRGQKGPSDARVGAKTGKDGKRVYFYGYDAHVITRVPQRSKGLRLEAPLAEALVVLPATTDLVKPCLRLIDGMLARGMRIRHLMVDRHYSYKTFDRWLQELRVRKIDQVADLHEKDQGFTIWHGMQVAASWPHCPKTPEHLAVIEAPGPFGTKEEWEAFNTKIEERQKYATSFINRPDDEGKCKVSCPALNGTVGCERRPGTVTTAVEMGMPIIRNPPADHLAPGICTQTSVTLRIQNKDDERTMKLSQKYYWGSRKWRAKYGLRTYVEGWFGVLKDPSSTGFDRNSHRNVGLPMVTIVVATAAAVSNMRLLRSWHEETNLGNPEHELLKPDQPFHGFTQLSKTAAMAMDKALGTQYATDSTTTAA